LDVVEKNFNKIGLLTTYITQKWKESVCDREKRIEIVTVATTLIECTCTCHERGPSLSIVGRTYLHANSQIVFLDRFVVQWMVDLYVSPSETVVLPLLQIERVEFVRLRRGSRHQPIEHGRISLDARAENIEILNQ